MFIDVDNRGTGKTSTLIMDAYFTGLPIVCATADRRKSIIDQAQRMGVEVRVYTVDEMPEKVKGTQPYERTDVLVDELEAVLYKALGVHVIKANMTRSL